MPIDHDSPNDASARKLRTLRICAWLVVAGVVCWQFTVSVRNAWQYGDRRDKVSDFTAFYGAGKLALQGEDIYDYKLSGISRRPYLYPPTFAVLPMLPLALLSYNAALTVFTLLNYVLLFGAFWLLRESLWRFRGDSDPPIERSGSSVLQTSARRQFLLEPNTGLMLAALVCFRFVHSNMRHVNANLYVVFALALGLYLIQRNGKPLIKVAGGAAIAWATAIKVTPALFGVYLLWSRRVWGMVGGAVGLIVFLFLIPAMRFGFSDTTALLQKYGSHISAAGTGEGGDEDQIGHPGGADQKQLEGGISLRGVWMRYLTPRAMNFEWAKNDMRQYYINVVDLPESTARSICRVGELLILLLTVALTARHFARSDPGALALSWGLVTLTMVLISPLTRKAHVSVLLIPAVAMIALIQQRRIRDGARKLCIAALAAICLQGVVFSVELVGRFWPNWLPANAPAVVTERELVGKFRSDWLQGAGLGFWFVLLVYAANAYALWTIQRSKALPPNP